MEQLKDIKKWLLSQHSSSANDKLYSKVNHGYMVLINGSSGADKTATVDKLSKEFNKEVYRVDLSKIASKYIGETEKNLAEVFDKAEKKNFILFFDEADALFGKRSQVKDSHDRYANIEVNYLLQQMEKYPGLVILATNTKQNIDEAFTRRFQSVLHFPLT